MAIWQLVIILLKGRQRKRVPRVPPRILIKIPGNKKPLALVYQATQGTFEERKT
jgi:hypothetical protein